MAKDSKAKARAKTKPGLAKRVRHKKALFLPLDTAAANRISLRSWTALQRARDGDADNEAALALAHAAMVAARVAEQGFGEVDGPAMAKAKSGLADLIDRGCASCDWRFSAELLDALVPVLDEHCRQLRQVRMLALVEANEWLEARLEKGALMSELLTDKAQGRGIRAVENDSRVAGASESADGAKETPAAPLGMDEQNREQK
ncbi:hypothetical protein [Caballeronia sp. BR00000012568055]|uniref:hypothetical protein n=1 Tax=Caballeronia sp. BR00000012568055 TaxID=2918761 RepID=UPI0023FA12DC|nr:hypothetical protein [Caballeronia sp. BR00000012568055]